MKYSIEIEDDDIQKIKKSVKEILDILAKNGVKLLRAINSETLEELKE